MSDLHAETSESPGTAGTNTSWQHETAETAPGHRRDSPAGTGDHGKYEETQAGTEARIAVQDELPSPAQSRAATWGDSPEYHDESELAGTYDGDLRAFLAAGNDLPTPQESRTRTWADNPDYHDETSLAFGSEHGPGAPVTVEKASAGSHDRDTGNRDQDVGTAGHQPDQTGTDLATAKSGSAPETPTADGSTGVQPASGEGSTADVPGAPSPELPPGSEHGDAATERVAQLDGDQAVPDTPPEADLKQQFADLRDEMQAQVDDRLQASDVRYQAGLDDLKAEYEAGKAQDGQQIDDLRAELQALKDDRPHAAPEGSGNTEIGADQPSAGYRERTAAREDATEAKDKDDRPGFWSNAKSALYGAVGTTVTVAGADQFFPGAPHPVVDIIAGGISIVAAYVPVLREGWKRKHDNPPDKP